MSFLSAVARNATKVASLVLSGFVKPGRGPTILMYHRVTGDVGLELDVRSDDFAEHMAWLSRNANVCSLDSAVATIQSSETASSAAMPQVVITFDDAYVDFYHQAWPLMQRLGLASTLYVPTGFIDDEAAVPVSRALRGIEKMAPVTWSMLREMAESPLVTIAAHSHAHNEYPSLSDAEIRADIRMSDDRFLQELGFLPKHFAYPRGAWDLRCEAIVATRYDTAALVGHDSLSEGGFNPLRVGRVPVLRSDRTKWFPHRVKQRLVYEEALAGFLRRRSQHSYP